MPCYLLAFCKTDFWLLLQFLCIAATTMSISIAIISVYANDLTQEHMVAKGLEFFSLHFSSHITKHDKLTINHAWQLGGMKGAILTISKT